MEFMGRIPKRNLELKEEIKRDMGTILKEVEKGEYLAHEKAKSLIIFLEV